MTHKPLISKYLLKRALRPRFLVALPILAFLTFILIPLNIVSYIKDELDNLGYYIYGWCFNDDS